MKPIIILAIWLAVNCSGFAESVLVVKTELTEYGMFTEGTLTPSLLKRFKTCMEPSTEPTPEPRLIQQTDQIPAKLKTIFGISYVIHGAPFHAPFDIRIRLTHPKITNPKTAETSSVVEYTVNTAIGERNYDAFKFDDSWEIALGKWTFQIFQGEQLLMQKTFEIKPET